MKFQKVSNLVKSPTKGTDGSAGYDLYVDWVEHLDNGTHLVHYGVSVEVPPNHVGLLVERSSLHKYGTSIVNKIGIIDSDYRGELMSPIIGLIPREGERVAQLVVVPCLVEDVEIVEELTNTERGEGSFGSTGVN